jgi:hypothetical protein
MLSEISQTQKDKCHIFSHLQKLDLTGEKEITYIGDHLGENELKVAWEREGKRTEYDQSVLCAHMEWS